MAWRHIMLAVASPDEARVPAADKVTQLGLGLDAEIELFHCAYQAGIARTGRYGSRVERQIRELVDHRHGQLEALAGRLRAQGLAVRTTVRWDDPPYEGVIRQVLRHKPDLLIAQSTRRGRVARVLTQMDYRLIEACPCPLLLIKTTRPYREGCIVAAVDPTYAHQKPPLLDPAILEAASALSTALGRPLHVYHACTPWPNVRDHSAELRHVPQRLQPDVQARYRERSIASVRDVADRQGVPDECLHVEEGEVVELLPRFARRVSAGIVVMGAVSRSRPQRMFIGHTAERVLDALDVDVMIVKPPAFRSPIGLESVHRLPKRATPRARYVL
jgi:universal stress protein E